MSIYIGQTWRAYKPGEDKVFSTSWVTRNSSGEMMSCVSSLEELIKNAILCKVRLKWISGKPVEMSPTDFCYNYFGKEKYVEFEKFVVDRGLSAQDLYEAARATKWKIESNGVAITKSGAESYLWKILWNKVRSAFTGSSPEKILVDELKNKNRMQPKEWAEVNKNLREALAVERIDEKAFGENKMPKSLEPPKPKKKRRINFDEE
jgi:hypothetical protein